MNISSGKTKAAGSLNEVNILGQVVSDPVYDDSKLPKVEWKIRVNRDGEFADVVPCVAFRAVAREAAGTFKEGDTIAINGYLQQRASHGVEIVARRVWVINAD